jgi:hypothetical protein
MQWRDVVALIVCGVIVWFVARSMFSQWRSGSQVQLRGKMSSAREWLEANGYQIIRIRERCEWNGYYDEREFSKPLIADFVVRQGARLYAVKVLNARDQGINGAKLRDQWYPLYVAYGVHGVLHVDVDTERVHVVDFAVKSPPYVRWRRAANRSIWLLSGAVLALAWFHGH